MYYTVKVSSNIYYRGTLQEEIDDVNMSSLSSDPISSVYNPTIPSWTTPSGGGLHLITDSTYDDLSRLTQVLGPSHQADVAGTPTTLRTATWKVYVESGTGDQTWTGQGYATGSAPSYTYTSLGPVQIIKLDKARDVTDSITSTKSTTGALVLQRYVPAVPLAAMDFYTIRPEAATQFPGAFILMSQPLMETSARSRTGFKRDGLWLR